jgi:asparagine synthase (glutamine-hydrolysing)
MCGIAGIVVKDDNHLKISDLKKMTDTIAHRGPDSEGFWISDEQNIGLGHRRLSIIDLSSDSDQPMHSSCGNYVIVFNGEIYNYLELKQELISQGELFSTNSDTEVLLKLYSLEKEKCLSKLDGMWAFAIWDKKEKTLFCARDRFGEKPFHYYQNEDTFYFASEMKALWAAGVPKLINDKMLSLYKKNGAIHNPDQLNETFYKNIFRLEHSHWMKTNSNGELIIQKYYDIDWKNQSYDGTFEEAQLKFEMLFSESLKRRLRSDVKVGTSLSGGLDSSVIVTNIAKKTKELLTFSARFKGYKKDESIYIDEIINKTGVKGVSVYPNGDGMFDEFDKLCFHQEEPFGSASIYAQYKVQQLAKDNDVTVLIDGQGADEILGGYIFYYNSHIKRLNSLKKFTLENIKEQWRYIDFHGHLKGLKKNIYKYFFIFLKQKNTKTEPLNKLLYDSTMKGPLQDLLRYADRNSMAHNREIRLPFLSKDLVEFCFSLPDDYKLKMGWTKFIMRKTFDKNLPSNVCWRKEKVGFETPQESWLNKFETHNWSEIMLKEFTK